MTEYQSPENHPEDIFEGGMGMVNDQEGLDIWSGRWDHLLESIAATFSFASTGRGDFVVLEANGVDGNVADVYGENPEHAMRMAVIVTGALRSFPILRDTLHRARLHSNDVEVVGIIKDGLAQAKALATQKQPEEG